jgi:photosystem II stability/assembly factor-like uncharacterized protein
MSTAGALTMRRVLGLALIVAACAVLGALVLVVTTAPAGAHVAPTVVRAASSPTPTPASSPWALVTNPSPSPASSGAIATFGSAGVAVTGTGGSIAVSTDGGATWAHRSLPDAPVTSVAFSDATHGWAVGPPDHFDATTDGGATWQAVTMPSGDTDTLEAIAADPSVVCALGQSSVLTSTDGGTTWSQEATSGIASYPSAPFSLVAGPAGFAAAAGGNGAFLTRDATGAWTTQASPSSDSVVALALARAPVWGDGAPDLFAITANAVLGSDDKGASFAALPAPFGAGQLSAVLLAAPRAQLLVAGSSGLLQRYLPSGSDWATGAWVSDAGPLSGAIVSCAAGPGSVAYALSAAGRVERTMSYGAAPFSLTVDATKVTAGGDVALNASSPIRAPGKLILEDKLAGGTWQSLVQPWPWSTNPATPGDVVDEPLVTTQYRLRFVFAGQTAAASTPVSVGVRPEITVARRTLTLHRGAVYRITGQVFPAEPGARVTIWTNRGGTWHKLTLGGSVALVRGSTFATRRFGTPGRESYELQVRIAADANHLSGASSRVSVTVK